MTEREMFEAALELPLADRDAYLDGVCGADAALRQRLAGLLGKHDRASSFLEEPAVPALATLEEPAVCEQPGALIGVYRLLEQIGEGGFGLVFMAEQQQPIRRMIALKVLKPGMDTRQVVARFEVERQALALMNHPNIAQVFDGGATESGRPYFVMELVRGVPITEYCDQNQFTPRERLELFVPICQAVQHAHQKGIIHRDIKPSNVLVTLHDGTPVVKVIDFGIAKAIGQRLTEKTLFTNFAQMIGTPSYMSPEQAEMSGLDIDTRTDIYSSGVLLYELLTGTTPFGKDRLGQAGYDEMRRIIREEEPLRPSTRISSLGQVGTTVAAQRKSDPKRLSQLFRGELDWIVMRCLDKDRNRRYETANSLARDIERYLNDEPVQACPPSAWYRLHKLARRNKTALAIVGLTVFFLALLVGGVGWAVRDQAARDQEAKHKQAATERDVNRALEEAGQLQRQKKWPEALEAAKRAEGFAAGAGESLRERVGELRRDVEMVLHLEDIWFPRELQKKDGAGTDAAYTKAFQDYGIDPLSLAPAEAAERVRDRTIWLELTIALDHWAKVRTDLSRGLGKANDPTGKRLLAVAQAADPDPWRNQVREALEERQAARLRQLAASPEIANQPLQTLSLLGGALDAMGAAEQAVAVLRQAQQKYPDDFEINFQLGWSLDHGQRVPQSLDEVIRFYTVARALRPRNVDIHMYLGHILRRRGMLDEAIAMYRQAISIGSDTPEVGPDHPYVVWSMHSLATAYVEARQPDKGVPLLEQVLEKRQARLSPDHADIVLTMQNLAEAYRGTGQLAKALPLFERTLEKRKAQLGADHADTLTTMHSLAAAYLAAGQPDKAAPLLEQTLVLHKGKPTPDWAEILKAMDTLATAHWSAGKWSQAVSLFEQALEQAKARLGLDHPQTLGTMNDLAVAYRDSGHLDRALPLLEQTVELEKAKLGPDHVQTLTARSNLAVAYWLAHDLAKALPLFEQTLERMKQRLGPKHPLTLSTMSNLAGAYRAAKRPDKSMPLLEQALEQQKSRLGPDHPQTLITMNNLALAYREAGRLDDALPLFEHSLETQKARPGPDHPDTLATMSNLAAAYQEAGKLDRAEPLFRELLKWRRQRDGSESPPTALALAGLGFNLLKQEKWVAAEAALRDCLAVCVSKMPNDALTCQVRSLLGGALLGQKKYAEAEPLLVQGCVGLKKHAAASREGRTRLCEALERLVRLCAETGRKDEAQAWAVRLEQAKPAEKEPRPQGK
jgi:serine/threonine protein kinase/lipopolysaccharide biosynthesis regulator YciM